MTPAALQVLGNKFGYGMVYCDKVAVNCFLVRDILMNKTAS